MSVLPRHANCLLVVLLVAGAASLAAAPAENRWKGIFRELNRMEKAEQWKALIPVLEKHLADARKAFGSDKPTTLSLMVRLARAYREETQFDRAQPLLESVLAIREKKLGKEHFDLAYPTMELAFVLRERGRYQEAVSQALRGMHLREKKLGKEDLLVAACLTTLADLYRKMGLPEQARPHAERCLAIREKKLKKDHFLIGEAHEALGLISEYQGHYTEAEAAIRKGLAIKEAALDKNHPRIADSLLHLSRPLIQLGRVAEAEKIIARAVAIHEAKFGKNHRVVATSLNNLAAAQVRLLRYPEAEANYLRSLKIREAIFPNEHPLIASALHHLAWLHERKKEWGKAEPMFRRALAIQEKTLGKTHPEVAGSLDHLAGLYRWQGQYARAIPYARRCLAIRDTRLGPDHPDVLASRAMLASLHASLGEVAEASKLYDLRNRGVSRHMLRILPSLSERDQATYLAGGYERDLHISLSLSRSPGADAGLREMSADWLLNGKAIAYETLASSALLTRDSSDPALTKDVRQLEQLRRDLARFTLRTPAEGKEQEYRDGLAKLGASEQEMARRVRERGGAVRMDWVELPAVRKALPRGAVLVDFLRLGFWDHKANKWNGIRYVAWITPHEGPVQVVDLGFAGIIDTRVRALRKELESSPNRIMASGEAEAEKALRPFLDAVSRLVLRPVLAQVGTSRRLILSPDASLWLVPWEALTLDDGRYAVEKYLTSYIASGRDLVRPEEKKVKQGPPLLLADPDYDLGEKMARAKPGASRLGIAKRLPATAREAKAVAPRLQRWAGQTPLVYQRDKALESVVKAARNPKALVLCTHGFFLPDQEKPRFDGDRAAPAPAGPLTWENPLLRSGLLLAGCNRTGSDRTKDDGVLTALEVVSLDLRGTELVVLSACETGLGQVRNGEGVAGLRQAFGMAGAAAVVSTLWSVPDEASALLMATFFDNLAKKQTKATALRRAQMKMIDDHREQSAAAHPFYWAAYTLTGR